MVAKLFQGFIRRYIYLPDKNILESVNRRTKLNRHSYAIKKLSIGKLVGLIQGLLEQTSDIYMSDIWLKYYE